MKNKTKIGIIIIAMFLIALFSGCVQNKCGDGICQRVEERKGSCPRDCDKPTAAEPIPSQILSQIEELAGLEQQFSGQLNEFDSNTKILSNLSKEMEDK